LKVFRKYYFFDIKNPREIENGKNKPKLIQRGPYTYSEVIEKKNVSSYIYNGLAWSPKVV
jgi:hypothetical protein